MFERRFIFLSNPGMETMEPLQKLAEGQFDTLLDDFEINGNLQYKDKGAGRIEIGAVGAKGAEILQTLTPTRTDDVEIQSSQINDYEGFALGIVNFYEKQGESRDEAILKAIQIAAIYLKVNENRGLQSIPTNSVFKIQVLDNGGIEIWFESLDNPVYASTRDSMSGLADDIEKQKLENQKLDYTSILDDLLSKLYDLEDNLDNSTDEQQQQCAEFLSRIETLRANLIKNIGNRLGEISMTDLRQGLTESKLLCEEVNQYLSLFN